MPLRHHPVHYFDDGNIIFILEDSIIFRLYRGAISRHSEVLSDMLAMPQPDRTPKDESSTGNTQEFIDGVPAVYLADKAESFALLLDIILPPVTTGYYEKQKQNPVAKEASLDSIQAILGLARKYCVPSADSWARMALQDRYIAAAAGELGMNHIPDEKFASAEEAAQLIRLARVHDLPQYLPLAFYDLVTRSALDSIFREDLLDKEDQGRLVSGRMKLTNNILDMAAERPENGLTKGPICRIPASLTNGRGCRKTREPLVWGDHLPSAMWKCLVQDPLRELRWRYDNWSVYGELQFCKTCSDRILEGFVADRKEMHRRLGEIFSLI